MRALLAFRKKHGHIDVPRRWAEDRGLAHWVINQRRLIRLGKLSPSRLDQLDRHGIHWQSAEDRNRERDRRWSRMCEALHAFLREHGHCDVPDGWKENPELARWVVRQRHLLRAGTLREDRARRFEERGIDWSLERGRSRSRDRAWERMFHALKEFRRAKGHCRVPKNWPERPELARWVARQRIQMRHHTLRPDRRGRLEELGLQGTALPLPRPPFEQSRTASPGFREGVWLGHYEALARFQTAEGHCDIPRRWPENPVLARWVCRQRELRRRGRLSAERIALLDRLKFSWSGREGVDSDFTSAWERAYDRLVAYRREHGHCNVPARWEKDPSLGRWVAAQRVLCRGGRLKPERRNRLSRLGFDWQQRRSQRTRAAF